METPGPLRPVLSSGLAVTIMAVWRTEGPHVIPAGYWVELASFLSQLTTSNTRWMTVENTTDHLLGPHALFVRI
jgi:hypothetical protein